MKIKIEMMKRNNIYISIRAGLLLVLFVVLNIGNVWADGSKDLYPEGATGGRAFLRASTTPSLAYPFPTLGTHYVYAEAGEIIALASDAQTDTNKRIYLYNPNGIDVTPSPSNNVGTISNRAAELAGPRLPGQEQGGNRYLPIYYTVPKDGDGIYKVEFRGNSGIETGDGRYSYSSANSWPTTVNTRNYLRAWDISVAKQTEGQWSWVPGRTYTTVLNMDNPSYGGQNGTDNANFRPNSGFYGKFKVLTRDGYVYDVDNNGNQGISFTFMVNNRGFHKDGDPDTPSYQSIAAPNAKSVQDRYHDPRTADAAAAVTQKIFYNLPDGNMPEEALGGVVDGGKTWLRIPERELDVKGMKVVGAEGSSNQLGSKGAYVEFYNESGGDYYITISPKTGDSFPSKTLTGPSAIGENRVHWDGTDGNNEPLPSSIADVNVELKLRGAEVHFPYIDMELNQLGIVIELLDKNSNYSTVISDKVYWDDTAIGDGGGNNGSKSDPRNASHDNPITSGGISSRTNGHKWGVDSDRTSGTFGDEQGMDTWTFIEGKAVNVSLDVKVVIADLEVVKITPSKNEDINIGDEITYTIIIRNNGPSDVTNAPFHFVVPEGFVPVEGDFFTFDGASCGSETKGLTFDATTNIFKSELDLPNKCLVTYNITLKVTDDVKSNDNVFKAGIMRPNDVYDIDGTNWSDPANTLYDPNNPDHPNPEYLKEEDLDKYFFPPFDPFFEALYQGNKDYKESNNVKSIGVNVSDNTTHAVDDFFEAFNNTFLEGNDIDVSLNDFDLENHTWTVTKAGKSKSDAEDITNGSSIEFKTGHGGTVIIHATGKFTYMPPANKQGFIDSFWYLNTDSSGATDWAEVEIAVGICFEQIEGESYFKWNHKIGDYNDGHILFKTYEAPVADYGFVVDLYDIDNSFNMEINGTNLAEKEIQFERNITNSKQNIRFVDGDEYSSKDNESFKGDVDHIWNIKGSYGFPIIRVRISITGKITMYGSKFSASDSRYKLERLELYEDNKFNVITMKDGDNEINIIKVTQLVKGATVLEGDAYGARIIECPNYWYGYEGADWDKEAWNEIGNWTDNYVPATKEDIEFATIENNRNSIKGMSGPGAGKGAAKNDLYVPSGDTKEIKDLINETVDAVDGSSQKKSLVIPPNSVLHIYGVATDSNTDPDKIVVKASKEDATGTLYFPIDEDKPDKNKEVQATVEFYNQAYDCKDCGYFTRSWQYFGIPVSEAGFPYLSPQMETINEWMENVNGNKWVPVTTDLKAFRGYEMTNRSTVKPDHIYEFQGKLNVGDASVSLTKTPNVNYSGMNLIGNSFTAAIPIDKNAIKYNDGTVADAVYLFNTGTCDQWRKLNGGNVPNVVSGTYTSVPLEVGGQAGLPNSIPSMHTFMVEAKSNTNIDLIYSTLVKNEAGEGQSAWRSAEQNDKQEIPHIVLDVIGTQSADRVWLFEQHGTTRGFDNGWDGVKMPEKDIVQIYVAGEDAKENYQVATVPQLVGTSFGLNTVNTVETGQALSNQSQSQLQLHMAVSPDVEIRGLYLRDMLTGRSYALKNGAEYRVSGSISSDNRFKVVDNALDESKLSDNPLIDIYVQDNQVVVANNSEEDCIVSLFDISGRLVAKRAVASNGTTYVSTAISGVYVVKVIGGTVNESKRVVVK